MLTFKFDFFNEDEGYDEEISVPGKYSICSRCEGTGVHDNENFSNGICSSDFEHPDDYHEFLESYKQGHFDVSCKDCDGSGKVIGADIERMSPKEQTLYSQYMENQVAYNQEVAWENRMRRMGVQF